MKSGNSVFTSFGIVIKEYLTFPNNVEPESSESAKLVKKPLPDNAALTTQHWRC